jgi:ATP-binding cassette, subfamily B, bacterial IrtA/YbtP
VHTQAYWSAGRAMGTRRGDEVGPHRGLTPRRSRADGGG